MGLGLMNSSLKGFQDKAIMITTQSLSVKLECLFENNLQNFRDVKSRREAELQPPFIPHSDVPVEARSKTLVT